MLKTAMECPSAAEHKLSSSSKVFTYARTVVRHTRASPRICREVVDPLRQVDAEHILVTAVVQVDLDPSAPVQKQSVFGHSRD